jgi:uncharacterized protein (TIGR01777 family)
MEVILTGGTGLIGSELTRRLVREGHRVTSLVRTAKSSSNAATRFVRWDVERGQIENEPQLEAHDAVIHLAGESVADGRWTNKKKQRIRDSRVKGTRLLVEALARLHQPPRVLLSASAIGFYGVDRGDEILTEENPPGQDFLAGVCREWEGEALRAKDFGVRVALLRTGIVLSEKGGALAKMLPIFKSGIGGKLGSGRQFMSWISLTDEVGAICFALENETMRGAINLVAPHPVRNAEFTEIIKHVLGRPAFLRVPRFALHLALGEMAETALASLRVRPAKLEAAGYRFEFAELEAALLPLKKPAAD